jgi:hypothetical protein
VSTDSAGRPGSAARPISRRILGFLASDTGLLLIIVLLGVAWFAGLLWLAWPPRRLLEGLQP